MYVLKYLGVGESSEGVSRLRRLQKLHHSRYSRRWQHQSAQSAIFGKHVLYFRSFGGSG